MREREGEGKSKEFANLISEKVYNERGSGDKSSFGNV